MAQPMKLCFTQDVMETSPRNWRSSGPAASWPTAGLFRYARAGSGGVSAGHLVMAAAPCPPRQSGRARGPSWASGS
jgi:hypothetical protein